MSAPGERRLSIIVGVGAAATGEKQSFESTTKEGAIHCLSRAVITERMPLDLLLKSMQFPLRKLIEFFEILKCNKSLRFILRLIREASIFCMPPAESLSSH